MDERLIATSQKGKKKSKVDETRKCWRWEMWVSVQRVDQVLIHANILSALRVLKRFHDRYLSYSSYTVEKKEEEEEEEEVGASATIPPGFTYCCLVEVCLLAGSSRAMLCCVLSEHSPHTRRISEQPGQVRLYRLFPPRLPPMGAKRLDERGGDYYSSSLSLNGERERANKDAVRQKQGGRRCWGPGRILEVYTTLTKDDVQAPSLLGETLLSLSLSLSPGLDELHDSCCCVSKTIPCCCANASPVPLFIYLLDVARKKKKERRREERKSIWLFIRVGAVVYFSHHSTAAETTKEISIYRASAASAASRSNAIIPGRV